MKKVLVCIGLVGLLLFGMCNIVKADTSSEEKGFEESVCHNIGKNPMLVINENTYSITSSYLSEELGIPENVVFPKNALKIHNKSYTYLSEINMEYNYVHGLDRFRNKDYFYEESVQYLYWASRTQNSNYSNTMIIIPEFEVWNSKPGYAATSCWKYSSKTVEVTYRTQY